jgi:hypothetical protein
MASLDRKELLERVRAKMKAKKGGKQKDPDEFRAPKPQPGQTFKMKGYVLPPLEKGEMCSSGKPATHGMDGLFFYTVGFHWIEGKPYACPRVFDQDGCAYCQLGFDLMRDTDDREAKAELAKMYLPRTNYVVNLFVPDSPANPEEVRGQVVYYAMPKTIFDKLDECINRDDAGVDPDDPQPFGLFFDPDNAYPLQIVITRKGEYPNYEKTQLLNSSGPIGKSEKEIEKILASRHDLPTKFQARDPKALAEIVSKILNAGDSKDSASEGGSGFDSDEDAPAPQPAPKGRVTVKEDVDSDEDGDDAPPAPAPKTKATVKPSDDEIGPAPKTPANSAGDFEDPEIAELLSSIRNKKSSS